MMMADNRKENLFDEGEEEEEDKDEIEDDEVVDHEE